jgi:hypothetical protein
MALSKRSIETLLDLVEIKLSCLQVFDRDDARELAALETARKKLQAVAGMPKPGDVVAFEPSRGRGRRQRIAV